GAGGGRRGQGVPPPPQQRVVCSKGLRGPPQALSGSRPLCGEIVHPPPRAPPASALALFWPAVFAFASRRCAPRAGERIRSIADALDRACGYPSLPPPSAKRPTPSHGRRRRPRGAQGHRRENPCLAARPPPAEKTSRRLGSKGSRNRESVSRNRHCDHAAFKQVVRRICRLTAVGKAKGFRV